MKLRHRIVKWVLEDYAKTEAIEVETNMENIIKKFQQDMKDIKKKREIYEEFYSAEIRALFFPFQRGVRFTIREVLSALIEHLGLELLAHGEHGTGTYHPHFLDKVDYTQEEK